MDGGSVPFYGKGREIQEDKSSPSCHSQIFSVVSFNRHASENLYSNNHNYATIGYTSLYQLKAERVK